MSYRRITSGHRVILGRQSTRAKARRAPGRLQVPNFADTSGGRSFSAVLRGVHCTALTLVWGALVFVSFGHAARADEPARSSSTINSSAEADWPRWRGAAGDAVLQDHALPEHWPTGPLRALWQVQLGTGWSSPVIAAGRVFISDRSGGSERVRAFDAASGRELWSRAHDVDFDPHPVGRRHGNGPKGTPLVDGDRVYAVGIAGWLDCLNVADGAVLWQVNFPAEFSAPQPLPGGRARVVGTDHVMVPIGGGQGGAVPLFGYTGSPTLEGNLLITPVGGRRGGTIMAFDKKTGHVVWKALNENVSYSSPIVAEAAGVRQVVVMTGPRVVGLALSDGALLWSHPFQIQYDESISTPAAAGDLVLVTATSKPLTALRISRSGEKFSAKVAWTNEILSSYLSSMVVGGEYVYGMNDGGEFSCLRLRDGKTMWTGGNHGYYSSPIRAGNRLLALNEQGQLAVFAAEPQKFQELGSSRLATSETWTMPAIVGRRIYVRSADSLACFEVSAAE